MKVAHLLKEPDDPNGPLTSEEIAELELLRKYANRKTSRSLRRFIERTSRINSQLAGISGFVNLDVRADAHDRRISRAAREMAQDATADYVTVEIRIPKVIATVLRYVERGTAEVERRRPRPINVLLQTTVIAHGVATYAALVINPTVFSFFRRSWNELCRREGVASRFKISGPYFPCWQRPDTLPGDATRSGLYGNIPKPGQRQSFF